MKLEFLSTGFGKIHKYQILRNVLHWEPSCFMRTYGQTDEADRCFSQFCEWVWKFQSDRSLF